MDLQLIKWVKTVSVVLTFSMLATIAGCAGNYGKLVRDQEVNTAFKKSRVLPDYNYYYSGPHDKPIAILGIHKDYSLKEGLLWNAIDLTDYQLSKWIQLNASDEIHNFRRSYYGYSVNDAEGTRIGIWYSLRTYTTITRGPGNEVIVYTPNRPGYLNRYKYQDEYQY